MVKSFLFIDGENFLHKIEEVLNTEGLDRSKFDLSGINLNQLLKKPLEGITVLTKIFYVAKIRLHPDTIKKSKELVANQRKLRNNLVNQGCEFTIAGNVRAQKIGNKVVFREKGVDVRIAVDMVTLACDKKMDTAILCSSDSDLQPAVYELKKRKVKVVYLGFEIKPNKGLAYSADRTILFRNQELLSALSAI